MLSGFVPVCGEFASWPSVPWSQRHCCLYSAPKLPPALPALCQRHSSSQIIYVSCHFCVATLEIVKPFFRMVFEVSNVFSAQCKICNFLHLASPCLKSTAKCFKCGREWKPLDNQIPPKDVSRRRKSRPRLIDDDSKKKARRDSTRSQVTSDTG